MAKEKRTGAPDCGLYIRIEPDFELDKILPQLQQVFFVAKSADYEMHMHAIELVPDLEDKSYKERAQTLIDVVKAQGFVAIIRGDADLAHELNADGVLLDLGKGPDVPRAKELLGEDRIVGMRCGLFEDMGDEALQLGADFVSFSFPDGALPPESIVSWWADQRDLPALVEGEITNDNCSDFINAGAMLLDVTSYVFDHPEGLMKGTVNMLYAIDLALDYRKAQD